MSRTCAPNTHTHSPGLTGRPSAFSMQPVEGAWKRKAKNSEQEMQRQHYLLNVWQAEKEYTHTHTWNERELCAGNERSLWIMQRTRAHFEQHQHRAHPCTRTHTAMFCLFPLDTCICIWKPFKRGWLKPLLLRRIMTTKVLHVISLNGQSTWDWTMLASSPWHIAHAIAHSLSLSTTLALLPKIDTTKKCKLEERVIFFPVFLLKIHDVGISSEGKKKIQMTFSIVRDRYEIVPKSCRFIEVSNLVEHIEIRFILSFATLVLTK